MKYTILIFTIFFLAACGTKNESKEAPAAAANAPVQQELATVEDGGISSVLKLPAQLAAYQEVSIFPRVNAYVKTVNVDVGAAVSQGQLLMTLEAPELQQAVAQAKEKYTRAQAEYAIDKERHHRLLEAAKTPGAISPMELSTSKARIEADSAMVNAERANWQIQQTMQQYLRVSAPFAGVITERNVHPGALVSSVAKDKPMLELKQINHLRLLVDVPEQVAGSLQERDTVSFYVSAFQGKRMTGFITRRSMSVSAQYRSERMEMDVPNPGNLLSPGMYADVQLPAKGNGKGLRVPLSAVVVSTERKYVLKSENGRIRKVDVSTGNRSLDKIEVYGDLKAGDKVVKTATELD